MSEDTISRKEAIDAMEDVDWYHINSNGQLVHGANSKEDEPLYKAEDVYKVLNDIPSAQPDLSEYSDKLWKAAYERGKAEPQQKWIPCSERMPEAGQKCLVCEKGTIAIDTYIGKGKPYDWRWYMRDYDAWMPLPKPYRAERETDGN